MRRNNTPAEAIDDYELATRLMAFVWNSNPDQELLHCSQNQLNTAQTLNAQVTRMLGDPGLLGFQAFRSSMARLEAPRFSSNDRKTGHNSSRN